MTSNSSAPSAPDSVELLDTPRSLAEARLFFIKATKSDLRKARKILGPLFIASEKFVDTTIVLVRTPQRPLTPHEVMVAMANTFGHIKSYDGCDMFLADAAKTELKEAAHG